MTSHRKTFIPIVYFIYMRQIFLCTNEDNFKKLEEAVKKYFFFKNIKVTEVTIKSLRPLFPSVAQIEYIKSIGLKIPELEQYRVYIGSEILDIKEYYGGVELPISVLDDASTFDREITERVRKEVGLISDN